MYFHTTNHYFEKLEDLDELNNSQHSMESNSNNDLLIEENTNDCLICLEIKDKTETDCIKLRNDLYIKACLCDGWIHYYCLDIWYIKNHKCPICLILMTKNESKPLPEYDVTTNTIRTIFNNIYSLLNTKCILRILLISLFFYNITFLIVKIIIFMEKS
jgi:hypothetical protein